MALEKWLDTYSRTRCPMLSIWRGGHLSVNHAARAQYGITTGQSAILYFDPKTRRIGLRQSAEPAPLYAKQWKGRGGQCVIFARAFLKAHRVQYDCGRTFLLTRDSSGMLIANLDNRACFSPKRRIKP